MGRSLRNRMGSGRIHPTALIARQFQPMRAPNTGNAAKQKTLQSAITRSNPNQTPVPLAALPVPLSAQNAR